MGLTSFQCLILLTVAFAFFSGPACMVVVECHVNDAGGCGECQTESCSDCASDGGSDLAETGQELQENSESESVEGGEQPPAQVCIDDGSEEKAVVVVLKNYQDMQHSAIGRFALNQTGRLRDTGERVGPIFVPQTIALRNDGQEAMVSWGTSSAEEPNGVVVVSLDTDGKNLQLAQTLDLSAEHGHFTATHVSYTSSDTVLLSRVGPGTNHLLPLIRQPDSTFAVGERYEILDELPRKVAPIPGREGHNLFLQSDFAGGKSSTIFPLSDIGGAVAIEGEGLWFEDSLFFMYMHPSIPRAYLPTSNPEDQSDDALNPTGLLRILSPSGGPAWVAEENSFLLPQQASLAAISPDGTYAVFTEEIVEIVWDPVFGCRQEINFWELYRVTFDGQGMPLEASQPFAKVRAFFVHDIQITRQGHILIARSFKTKDTKEEVYDMVVLAHAAPGEWVECPNPVPTEGSAEFVISD